MEYLVRTKYTYVSPPGEITGEDTPVVPDDTMSIRDLLIRFTKGMPPAGTERPTIYDPEDNWDIQPENRQNADLADIDELKHELYETASRELQKSAVRRGRKKRVGDFESGSSQSPSNTGENVKVGAKSNGTTSGANSNE